ncbi:helix-turn-helix protein [Fructobacillus sp. EFB-N1]|nr:helix-turn-helix transcriptional regulator [Fructobacillus sp. EFB-N1]KMK53584.1 helix-turn-helix protein [Fructobacillus sp. EFB-N1]
MTQKTMSEILKKLRILYDSSAKDFSTLLDISPSYLSEIENGKKSPA